ncbi:alpha/beta hydrolase [Roseovarius phycicola]|uniref:Alpha/beta hydrolase n=1 Tax=Roseovarius phycicola TaxID=3080976 RepID=A0ABZ2HKD6_9RHOB
MSKHSYHHLAHPPKPGAPLIFAFHGTGGDEAQFFSFARRIDPSAGIVAPKGDVDENGAARFFKRKGEGLYDMEDLPKRVGAMAALISAHANDHPTSPIYGFGYSNGANILSSVIMAWPELFDRAGLMHPMIPWAPEPVDGLQGREVFLTAGRNDPICPWSVTERLITWFDAQGAQVETLVHDGGHEIALDEYRAVTEFLKRPAKVKGDAT